MNRPLKASILPQGQSIPPSTETTAEVQSKEEALIAAIFPPNPDEIVLVGLGFIDIRKGVDIFLEVASILRSQNPSKRYRFVWVGDGKPVDQSEYPRFLRDQAQRAGIESIVHFLPAVSSIEKIYERADALLLTSRLDPLPNVAIDMIAHSKPIFCFDKTTGFVEILNANGFAECVAVFINPADMAEKVAKAIPNKDAARELGIAQNEKISPIFNMKNYVAALDRLALSSIDDKDVFRSDVETIAKSNVFKREFYEADLSERPELDVIEEYVSRCKSGLWSRRALPGFHPYIYASLNNLSPKSDPLADYLKTGMPNGPWKSRVISEADPIMDGSTAQASCALHIHAFYIDSLPDIISRVTQNAHLPDLFISTRHGCAEAVASHVRGYPGNVVAIREVPNVGRDVAPFITEFGPELSTYDIVGHVHTKQSLHVNNRTVIDRWCKFVLTNMLGSSETPGMIDRILGAFADDGQISLVFPEDPHIMGWTENRQVAAKLAQPLGLEYLPEHFNFPIGSMFWMKSNLYTRFLALDLKWSDYPSEPLPIDGTILHALERLFGALPQVEGEKIAVTNIRGLTR